MGTLLNTLKNSQGKFINQLRAFKTWPKAIKILIFSVFCLNIALNIRDTTFTNFANSLGIQAQQFGVIESLREVPGLLTVVLAMLTYFFSESLLAALCLFTVGIGILLYVGTSTFSLLVVGSVVYSVGFHVFFPLQDSMSMKFGKVEESGRILGFFGSVAAAASLCGTGVVIILSKLVSMKFIFLIAVAFALLGGFIMLSMPKPEGNAKPKTLIFRKRYKFYYLLTFLSGCRRHIFTVFAPLTLIQIFHMNLTSMAILALVNQILNIFAKQTIGRMVDNLGERIVLLLNFGLLTIVFLGYAQFKVVGVICLLYILDNIFFGFNMAISTYLRKICPPEELGPSLSMGSTVNHIVAFVIPLIGGFIWKTLGYQYVFLMGSVITFISLIITYNIKELADPLGKNIDKTA